MRSHLYILHLLSITFKTQILIVVYHDMYNILCSSEAEDVERHLGDCKAVLVDITAKRDIVEAVVDNYVIGSVPLILVCWEAGTIDARKNLARMIIERCSPSLISGRLGDVHALTIDIMDRGMLSS